MQCAQCNLVWDTSMNTEPLCATCDLWFCRTCTDAIKNDPQKHVDWRPCMQIDGNACPPAERD